jgi:protein arginine kinase activator
MKCDLCDNEATVHEMTQRNGVRVEKHLCEACASKQGIGPAGATLGELLTNFVLPASQQETSRGKPARAKSPTCATCGFTFEQFRQAGLLGCPECYAAFEARLIPLLERAHEGASTHVGKQPKRLTEQGAGSRSGAGAAESQELQVLVRRREREEREKILRRQLEDAVKTEQYELAARIRDQLRKLEEAAEVDNPKGQKR